jgi:hypothetical protein
MGGGMETLGEDIYHIQNYVYNLVTLAMWSKSR